MQPRQRQLGSNRLAKINCLISDNTYKYTCCMLANMCYYLHSINKEREMNEEQELVKARSDQGGFVGAQD